MVLLAFFWFVIEIMYGIEYSALADVYLKEEEKEEKSGMLKNLTAKRNFKPEQATITSKQKLLQKLHTLKECPDYLLPKFFASSGTGSSLSNTQKSKKSNENVSKEANTSPIYYTDDFILLSEFSEIEGPKPLLTIPTDGGTNFNKNEYSLHRKFNLY